MIKFSDNLFINNSLLSKLWAITDDISDGMDKEIIMNMIRKYLPKDKKYFFTPEELSVISKRDAGYQAWGVSISERLANEYMVAKYKIDFFAEEYNSMYSDNDFALYLDNFYDIKTKMDNDFKYTRAYIKKISSEELTEENIRTFDLYTTNLYIEYFTKIKDEFEIKFKPK